VGIEDGVADTVDAVLEMVVVLENVDINVVEVDVAEKDEDEEMLLETLVGVGVVLVEEVDDDGGGGDEVEGGGADVDAGVWDAEVPALTKSQEPVRTPTDSGAKNWKSPWDRSRPP